ncbi:hypothetical protein LEMLEM_LOCUS20667 [Lemmus lemmus]
MHKCVQGSDNQDGHGDSRSCRCHPRQHHCPQPSRCGAYAVICHLSRSPWVLFTCPSLHPSLTLTLPAPLVPTGSQE